MGIRKDLRRALGAGRPVRVRRAIKGADRLSGYVIGVGRTWVLLQEISCELRLDGYAAVRLRDVESASGAGWAGSDFTHRALRSAGERARPLPGVDLDSTAGLIETLGAGFPLLGLHIERVDPDVMYVGHARGITRKGRLRLQEISSKAVWESTCVRHRLADTTRVDAGGGYLDALHRVGGVPPVC
ncbi:MULTISPECIES: hypothetical protein [Streptosporangium]|uniref:Uncharacterized protein n=1 Tax=Streptosporangium brasiliense TaxID=47480 RepID=A0ABT9RAP0_9ACTN|nr:hypothetical protein [Streptosporangium brasiliense]MDP9865926.1 hypothetical protein [Streptosporangium brasiliense]